MSLVLLSAVLLPALAAALIGGSARAARMAALAVTAAVFGLCCVLAVRFPGGTAPFAAIDWPWLASSNGSLDIRFALAIDGLNLWLIVLSALLSVVCVLVSWTAVVERAAFFYRLLLLLETGMLGVFAAQDIIVFYIFFEFGLIPMFFLIGIWGSEERRRAAVKFFLYTLAGSLLTFLAIVTLVLWDGLVAGHAPLTFSIPELTARLQAAPMPLGVQLAVFAALWIGFAIKVPLFPLHTWLPLAHVQAPAAGSVLLAGVLLKIGVYGFLRFNLPMLPDASAWAVPVMLYLGVIGILYGALVALAQKDIKKLIAYSSVSHLGFCALGVFALNPAGVQGGALQMINHGLSTGGLFALVGMIYERYHTRNIAELGGLARRMPRLAFFMLLMSLASIGLPGLGGFVGELLVLIGAFQRGFTWPLDFWGIQFRAIAVAAVFGVVLGAWYMLWLIERVFFGPLSEPGHGDTNPPADLTARESLALVLLSVPIVAIGLWPELFLRPMADKLDELTAPARVRFESGKGTSSGHEATSAQTVAGSRLRSADEPLDRLRAPTPDRTSDRESRRPTEPAPGETGPAVSSGERTAVSSSEQIEVRGPNRAVSKAVRTGAMALKVGPTNTSQPCGSRALFVEDLPSFSLSLAEMRCSCSEKRPVANVRSVAEICRSIGCRA